MAVQYIANAQDIVGPEAGRAGTLAGAAIGAYYFTDDTGLVYRKSVAGAWQLINPVGAGGVVGGVQGSIAHDAVDSGNPVKIGGVAGSIAPAAVAVGDRANLWVGVNGQVVIAGLGITAADGYSNTLNYFVRTNGGDALLTTIAPHRFNGSTWDRERGNQDLTVLASAARTATLQSSDIVNYNARGLILVIDVTAAAATPSVVFTIQGKDALSGKYYTILASAAITGTGTTVLRVFPGATASPNLIANDVLPRTWRVDATHADADSITYSVGASLIL